MTRSYLGYVSSQTTDTIAAGTSGNQRRVVGFTATNSSYTVPDGVTYMIAHIRGGGGGVGKTGAGAGGTSSVAFSAGTQSAVGGDAMNANTTEFVATAGAANSGEAALAAFGTSIDIATCQPAVDGREIVAGGNVTAGATLAITVGAGGVAGTSGAAGGSGYVWLEYEVSTTEQKKLYSTQFTATNSSYTVPAGVTHMIAHMIGGGGGYAQSSAGNGTASSVAFASGTVSANGATGSSINYPNPALSTPVRYGQGAYGRAANEPPTHARAVDCRNGAYIVAGGNVTAGATLAITVGAGGSGGTGGVAGAQGYVWLEFYGD